MHKITWYNHHISPYIRAGENMGKIRQNGARGGASLINQGKLRP